MIICSQCRREIPEINEGKFCPFCGAVLGSESAAAGGESIGSAPSNLPDGESSAAPQSAAAGERAGRQESASWEDRDRAGLLQAFSQTWSDATFRPAQFFHALPRTGNLGPALLFAFIIGMVATLVSSFWQYQFWDSFSELSETPELRGFERLLGEAWSRDMLRFYVISSPLWVLVSILLRAAILHVALIIVGGNRHGWEATFRTVTYSSGPQLFAIIPWCGDVVSFLWQIALAIIGLRAMHETTTARAAWAVALPFVLCCCSISALAYRLAEWASRLGVQI